MSEKDLLEVFSIVSIRLFIASLMMVVKVRTVDLKARIAVIFGDEAGFIITNNQPVVERCWGKHVFVNN